MKKVNIDFNSVEEYINPALPYLFFIQAPACKMFRVCISQHLSKSDKYNEIIAELDKSATLKRKDVWYFAPRTKSNLELAWRNICVNLGITAFIVEPDND